MHLNKGDALPSVEVKASNSLDNTTSEGSSVVAVSQSVETKAAIISDASKEVEMISKLPPAGAGVENQLSSVPGAVSLESNFSSKHKGFQALDGHDDSIPSLSRTNGTSVEVVNNTSNVGSEDLSHSPAAVSGSGCAVRGDTEIANKIFPETDDAGKTKDSKDASVESSKHLGQDDYIVKSNKMVQLGDVPEPLSLANSGGDDDESEMVEQDVKVCDICGDTGREDLLAICSRCSDGAEHTYCMRGMLDELPQGEWLCEECELAEETQNLKTGKRHGVKTENVSVARREDSKTSTRPPSWGSSFKNSDKRHVKHPTTNRTTIRSQGSGPRLQKLKGTLLKSNSFNAFNSKAKLRDEVFPNKQKTPREHSSYDTKEGSSKTFGKSMSFRSTNGFSDSNETTARTLSSEFPHSHKLKSLKPMKEQSSFEKKNVSKLEVSTSKVDQKLALHGQSIAHPSSHNSHELKSLQSDGKLGRLRKSVSSLARNHIEIPVTSVGASSTDGISSPSQNKAYKFSPKEKTSSSSSAEKSSDINVVSVNGLPGQRESRIAGEKTKEKLDSRPRPKTISIPCQKCKEVGHATELCQFDSPQSSGSDISTGKLLKVEMDKGNKLKAAIEAAKRKTLSLGRTIDRSDRSSVSNMENGERPSAGQSLVSNKLANVISNEGRLERQAKLQCSSDSYRQTTADDAKEFIVLCTDNMLSPKFRESDDKTCVKQTIRAWANHALEAMSILSKISAIPEHDYIWQGGFEVHRGENPLELHSGIQAHLSTFAAKKVVEMVKKFPERVCLTQVPRLSTWPKQFHDSGATEDHIALYFFAKDIESYEQNYKPLLDNMINKDLGLKGKIDGVELLIFPSSQLPQNCQRWNRLLFLWGVFRGSRVTCSKSLKESSISRTNSVPQGKDDYSDVSSQNPCFPSTVEKELSTCKSSCDIGITSDATGMTKQGNSKVCAMDQAPVDLNAISELQENEQDSQIFLRIASSAQESCLSERHSGHQEKDRSDLQAAESGLEMTSVVREDSSSVKIPLASIQEGSLVVSVNERKIAETNSSDGSRVTPDRHYMEDDRRSSSTNMLGVDLNTWQPGNLKRLHTDLIETNRTLLNDANSVFVDKEYANKKAKTSMAEVFEFRKPEIERDNSQKFGTTMERYFFPLDANRSKAYNSTPLKDLSSENDVVPSLELALGAETKPRSLNRGIPPLYPGVVTDKCSQTKTTVADTFASLSLSLSPFPDQEQTMEPVSSEQQHGGTSMLFFPGIADK